MNLSVKNLRRSATMVGGAIAGLGIVAAMATPALACHPTIAPGESCVNADGSWVVNWSVVASDVAEGRIKDLTGEITNVTVSPNGATITGITTGPLPTDGVKGVEWVPPGNEWAKLSISAQWTIGDQTFPATREGTARKPEKKCASTPTTPATTQPTTTQPTTPAPTPTTSIPVIEPQFVYDENCTTLTVGIEVPKSWKKAVTVTFTPSTGAAQTVTAKPGETKTVEFKASKGLTVKAAPKDYPNESATITYKAPKECNSSSPAATPSTTPAALAITGSSSTPIAGGAIALLVLGGGAFFLARRRKMKFTA